MIGVIADDREKDVVKEFFELFKTPWEFYDPSHFYDAILSSRGEIPESNANLLLIYGSQQTSVDSPKGVTPRVEPSNASVVWNDIAVPIYGDLLIFKVRGYPVLRLKGTQEPAALRTEWRGKQIVRVGFDLFAEIAFLLSKGQPARNAHIPALEIHISMLRTWILEAGIPLVEIPPVPPGYKFIVCLTHDVDFVRLSHYKFDKTFWGFAYRASLGSWIRLFKGKLPLTRVLQNLKALLLLPSVYFGLSRDFWLNFDRYLHLEKDSKATFFLIPFKNRAGDKMGDLTPHGRETRYDIADIEEEVQNLLSSGFEIGVHGIDAWHSKSKAHQELERVAQYVGQSNMGIRMHWLFWEEQSFKILEEAGFNYDSTFGYNETVGYRGGTTQVFRPIGGEHLLELPLHIQDMALLSPGQLGLSETEAMALCKQLSEDVLRYGGVLTVLWHLRSLGPERLWGDFYLQLLDELKAREGWLAPAGQAVEWFRARRAAHFKEACVRGNVLWVNLDFSRNESDKALLLRIHIPVPNQNGLSPRKVYPIDIPLDGRTEKTIILPIWSRHPKPNARPTGMYGQG